MATGLDANGEHSRADEPVQAVMSKGFNEGMMRRLVDSVGLRPLVPIFDLLPCGVSITFDPSCRHIIHNRAASEFLRLQPGVSWPVSETEAAFSVYRQGRLLAVSELPMQTVAQQGQMIENEQLNFVWPDGTRRTAIWNVTPLRSDNGAIFGAIATIEQLPEQPIVSPPLETAEPAKRASQYGLQVTDTHRLAAELQRNSQQTMDIVSSISDAYLELDAEFNIIRANRAAATHYQLSLNELVGMNMADLSPKFQDSEYRQQFHLALSRQQPVHFESFGNLTFRWMSLDAYPTENGLAVYFRDITKQRSHQAAQSRLAAIVENSDAAIIHLNPDLTITDWNPSAERMFQFSAAEAIGRKVLIICPEHKLDEPAELMDKIMAGVKVNNFETVRQSKDGTLIDVMLIASPVKNARGDIVSESLLLTDISEKKQMEREFLRLDRLKQAGQLAAAIGHEIRNPMTTVRGFLQFLSMKPRFAEEQDLLQLMIAELDRANEIITEFLDLAKGKTALQAFSNLSETITQLAPLIQADATLGGHELVLELSTVPSLLLEEKDARQLLLNLVRNGLEAMDQPGKLFIRTLATEHHTLLQVADQGHGIADEHLDKIYFPFFSTKENGTGLGLSVCYRIADQHNAKISIETSPAGTTFTVSFPLPTV